MKELKLPDMTDQEKLLLIRAKNNRLDVILSNAGTFKRKIGNRNVEILVEYISCLTDTELYFETNVENKTGKIRMINLIEKDLATLRMTD